jgi:hypothetical protein
MPHIGEFVTFDDVDWVTATLLNSWTSFSATYNDPAYARDSLGVVHLRGAAKGGVASPALALFVLPAGFRPNKDMIFPVVSNDLFGLVIVQANGNVLMTVGSGVYVSLDGIDFRAYK